MKNEQAIIGLIVSHPDKETVQSGIAKLSPRLFGDPRHRMLLRCVQQRLSNRKPCGLEELIADLNEQQVLEDAGGFAYVSELASRTESPALFPTMLGMFIAEVRERFFDELKNQPRRADETETQYFLRLATEAQSLQTHTDATCSTGAEEAIVFINYEDVTKLDRRRNIPGNPPPPERVVFKMLGRSICTAGNVTVVHAPPKAGKTAMVTAFIASAIAEDPDDVDLLGLEAEPLNGALIHLDTEQSPLDSWQLIERASRRAETPLPDNVFSYRLLDVPIEERRSMLKAELHRRHRELGRIHSVIIDGIGDLCSDLNRPDVAFPLVDELMGLAVRYDCPIICVLHENPNTQASKTRGHLGSQLERKAETNLRVKKADSDVSTVWTVNSRKASIPEREGLRFKWCDKAMMHVTTYDQPADKADSKRKAHQPVVDEVFRDVVGEVRYADLREHIESVTGKTERTAERRINDWLDLGLIEQTNSGAYTKVYRHPSTTVK